MQPNRVVPSLDKAETGHSGLDLRGEAATFEQCAFQGLEEALAQAIMYLTGTV